MLFVLMASPLVGAAQTPFGNVFSKLKLEVRADGEYTTTDTTPNLGFHGKYFNFMLGGDLGGGSFSNIFTAS